MEGGSCGDLKKLDLFIAVFNLLLDGATVVLPMPVLWGLKMKIGRKLALSGIFGMGILYVFYPTPPFLTYPPSSISHNSPSYHPAKSLKVFAQ